MKKILKLLIVIALLFSFTVSATEIVTLYFFNGDGFTHCV